ncbi:MAG: hypothetical protein MUC51_20465 [Anaerolineae bacterium]|nr:hypothetical protein [Anaerolineae bacterium]
MQINLYLTNLASPDATTELPDDPEAAARGRNGWFCPRQIAIWRGEQIWVAVRSRRMGENAPIQLQIAPAAAHALGGALLLATADSTTRQTDLGTVPVEVEWHSEYSGGDFDDTGELTIVEVPVGADGCVTDALVNAAFTHAMGQDPIHIIRWIEAEEPLGGYRVCSVCRTSRLIPSICTTVRIAGIPSARRALPAAIVCASPARAAREARHAEPDPPTPQRRAARRGAGAPLRPTGGTRDPHPA